VTAKFPGGIFEVKTRRQIASGDTDFFAPFAPRPTARVFRPTDLMRDVGRKIVDGLVPRPIAGIGVKRVEGLFLPGAEMGTHDLCELDDVSLVGDNEFDIVLVIRLSMSSHRSNPETQEHMGEVID
jgi:hypothetical protein